MRRPLALLLDLDGTLVDSRVDIADACNAALALVGLPLLERAQIVRMVGDGASELVTRALSASLGAPPTPERHAAALEAFRVHYTANACVHTALLPGARELLGAGVRCALYTNKPRAVTEKLLVALGIDRAFEATWAADGPLKPSPEGAFTLARQLGIEPRDAWMVGDGPQDVGAGRAAGAWTVAVPGFAEPEAIRAARPDVLAESLLDVARLVATSL